MAKKNTPRGCIRCASADDIEKQLVNYAVGMVGLRRTDGNEEDTPPDGWVQNNLILDGRCGYLTADDDSAGFYVVMGNTTKNKSGIVKRYDVPRYVFAKASRTGEQTPFSISTDRMHIIRANPMSYPPIISIRRYAALIAQCYTALAVNLRASMKAQMIGCDQKQKDNIEDFLMDVYGGQAYGIFEKDGLSDISQLDISVDFRAPEIHDLLRTLEGDAHREIGGVTPPQFKAERTQSAEVSAAIGETIDCVNLLINTANADLQACGAPYEFYNRGFSARFDEDIEGGGDYDEPTGEEDGENETV